MIAKRKLWNCAALYKIRNWKPVKWMPLNMAILGQVVAKGSEISVES